MVRIRMQRFGRKNRPFYRIAAVDKHIRRDGPVIEELGWFDPLAPEAKQLNLKDDRVKYWLSVGAQPTETLKDVFAKRDLIKKAPWEAERKRQRDLVAARAAAAPAEADAKSAKGAKKN